MPLYFTSTHSIIYSYKSKASCNIYRNISLAYHCNISSLSYLLVFQVKKFDSKYMKSIFTCIKNQKSYKTQ